jgi:hypothetical protein
MSVRRVTRRCTPCGPQKMRTVPAVAEVEDRSTSSGLRRAAQRDLEFRRELERALGVWAETRCPGGSFPSYMLTNLSGNISRNGKRLAQLESRP